MSRVFWDTNLFIYLLEDNPLFCPPTAALLRRIRARGDELLTSSMTVGEVQVRPRRLRQFELAERYRLTISSQCTVISFNEAAADLYARIPENSAISPPDAIQLGCAASAEVDIFVTNDRALQKLNIPNIGLIASLDRLPI